MTKPPSKLPLFDRRLLAAALSLLVLACGGTQPELASDTALETRDSALTSVRIRLMAANITSGNVQSYDPGEGIRIFQGTQARTW